MNKQPTKRYHLILDAIDVKVEYLTDKDFLEEFLKEASALVDMKILYGPIVAEGVPENPGLSAFCIIDYSHIQFIPLPKAKNFISMFFLANRLIFPSWKILCWENLKLLPNRFLKQYQNIRNNN